MAALLKERSKITEKGQTTIPRAVRQALGVGSGDHVGYIVDSELGVRLVRVETEDEEFDEDPVIEKFLAFLAVDMQRDPAKGVVAFPEALVARLADLTKGVVVDLDEPIRGPVAL